MSKSRYWMWAGLLLGAALLLRVLFPAADGPGFLDSTGFLVSDEGWYAGEAARAVLGIPAAQFDLNTVVQTPLFHLWALLALKTFGVAIYSVRLFNVLAGCATVAALAWIGRKSGTAGLLAAALVAFDYNHLMFSRIGGSEPLQVLLATLALMVYVAAERRPWLHVAGVALAFSAGLVKTNGMVFVAVYLLAEALRLFGEREGLKQLIVQGFRRLLLPGATAGVLGVAWILFWVRPHYAAWQGFNAHTVTARLPDSAAELARNLTAFVVIPPLAPYSFLVMTLGIWGLVLVLARLWRREAVPRPAIYGAAWVLLMTAMLMPYNYQPERYFMVYLPALAVLSAFAVLQSETRAPLRLLAGLSVWILLTLTLQGKAMWGLTVLLFLAIATFLLQAYRDRPEARSPQFVFLALAVLAVPYLQWATDLRYTVVEVGKSVGERVRAEATEPCLMGSAAGTLALVNHLPTRTTTYSDLTRHWEHCRPTHLLVSAKEWDKLTAKVPDLEQYLEYLGTYIIYENYEGEPWVGEKFYRIKPEFAWPAERALR